jgi:hypothetical protein
MRHARRRPCRVARPPNRITYRARLGRIAATRHRPAPNAAPLSLPIRPARCNWTTEIHPGRAQWAAKIMMMMMEGRCALAVARPWESVRLGRLGPPLGIRIRWRRLIFRQIPGVQSAGARAIRARASAPVRSPFTHPPSKVGRPKLCVDLKQIDPARSLRPLACSAAAASGRNVTTMRRKLADDAAGNTIIWPPAGQTDSAGKPIRIILHTNAPAGRPFSDRRPAAGAQARGGPEQIDNVHERGQPSALPASRRGAPFAPKTTTTTTTTTTQQLQAKLKLAHGRAPGTPHSGPRSPVVTHDAPIRQVATRHWPAAAAGLTTVCVTDGRNCAHFNELQMQAENYRSTELRATSRRLAAGWLLLNGRGRDGALQMQIRVPARPRLILPAGPPPARPINSVAWQTAAAASNDSDNCQRDRDKDNPRPSWRRRAGPDPLDRPASIRRKRRRMRSCRALS